jgi:hypothetical protein
VNWTYENVDGYNVDMHHSSVAVDRDGWPHIAYRDNSNGSLKYARRSATGWSITTVRAGIGSRWPSLVLDSTDHPCIAYKSAPSSVNTLMYSYRDTSGWHHETVEGWSGENYGSFPSLALDVSGAPCIAYRADEGSGYVYVKYARRDSANHWSTWVASSANPYENGDNGGISLGFDGCARPHIVFFTTSGDIDHAWYRGPYDGWQTEVAVSGTGTGTRLGMKIEGDNLHVVYNKENGEDLGYARKTSSGWTNEVVETDHPDFPSLSLDHQGFAHVAYEDPDNKNICYAYNSPSGWQHEVVYSAASNCAFTSIALNAADEPCISAYCYYGSSDYRLKLFRPQYYRPGAFNLLSPANGAWANGTPLVRWEQCSSQGDSLACDELWIDGVLSTTVPSTRPYAVPDNPLASGWRSWQVKARKVNGDSVKTTSWTVRVDPDAPSSFDLTSPANDTWMRNRRPTLAWQPSSDNGSGLKEYRIYVGDSDRKSVG